MSTSIFVATEIRENGKWRFIEDVPSNIKGAGYSTFGALAGVKDSFGSQVFKPRGLPEDISSFKVHFQSCWNHILKLYNDDSETMCVIKHEDGRVEYIKPYDDRLKVVLGEDEYNKMRKDGYDKTRYSTLGMYQSGRDIKEYYTHDAFVVGGIMEAIPYKTLYSSVDEFAKERYDDEWDEEMQDYGSWDIDFSCSDYHSQSYLSLADLLNADYTPYNLKKYKMDKEFYDAFINAGGVMPADFSIKESAVGDLIDCFRESMSPTITIMWNRTDEEIRELPMHKGIEELKQIAAKYNVSNDDIRIIFAFD